MQRVAEAGLLFEHLGNIDADAIVIGLATVLLVAGPVDPLIGLAPLIDGRQ
jgi:hypothetical protein